MTKLLVQELKSEDLSQTFRLKHTQRYLIGAFCPYLYIHDAPAGTFTFEVISNGETVFTQDFESGELISDMGYMSNYMHVFYPFMPYFPIMLEKGEFTLKLSSSGYTYTPNSFIGWIQQHEDLNNQLDYEPVNDAQNPLAMRLKIYKQGILI